MFANVLSFKMRQGKINRDLEKNHRYFTIDFQHVHAVDFMQKKEEKNERKIPKMYSKP